MTFTIRRLRLVVFGLAFVPNLLQAQYASPPQTYSMTLSNSMTLPVFSGMTITIYRDGSKVLMDKSRPPTAKNPKGYHSRTLRDLQAHKYWIWDLLETSSPCGAGTFSGDWGDPFDRSSMLSMTANLPKDAKESGMETVNGIATKVFEFIGPHGGGKLWVDTKYGLIIKSDTIAKNGQHQTMREVKEFSLAKPPASVFALPPACAGAPITGHSDSTLGPGGQVTSHAEAQIGGLIPSPFTPLNRLPEMSEQTPASESQKGPPQNAPSQQSVSQIGLPSGTQVSAKYEDGTEVKLKPEEQVALLFLMDIAYMEETYCRSDKPCSLGELIKGVKGRGIMPPMRLSRDPNQDPNYRYTVTQPAEILIEAIPRRPGLGGFLFFGRTNRYYNPNGAASIANPKRLTPTPGEGTKSLSSFSYSGESFKTFER